MRRFMMFLAAFSAILISAAEFDAAKWEKMLRPDHPRLLLNSDQLPALRERLLHGSGKQDFAKLKKTVDALPADAPAILLDDKFTTDKDGKKVLKNPGMHGEKVFRYNGGDQAAQCALVYLMTGEKVYLEKTKNYLRLFHHVAAYSCDVLQTWLGWINNVEVNALCAYDWIYNDLTPEERKELLLPILSYVRDVQADGKYTFRRTVGDNLAIQGGNYGLTALQWFSAIAGMDTGVDDALCREFFRKGGGIFFRMLDYREQLSGGSGLLVAATATYSFSQYPFATFLFYHSLAGAFSPALAKEVAQQFPQMSDYPNWFDFAAIRKDANGKFLTYGVGDMYHKDNLVSGTLIYTHLAQAIHFYHDIFPEKTAGMYGILKDLPPQWHKIVSAYTAVPFLLSNFDPAKIPNAARPEASDVFFAPRSGILIVRSGSGPDDTYALFRCGSSQWIHQHFDELSFIIYKKGFLAIDSGTRCNTAHSMYYAPQTVAHNTLLLHADPEEPMPYWYRPWGYKEPEVAVPLHGGQSISGKGKPLAFHPDRNFVYCASDAAVSYGKKCKEAVRQFLYLKPDCFVIYDRMTPADPASRGEWLLHTAEKPVASAPGIHTAVNGGKLLVQTLLPEKTEFRLVGGKDKEFFASGQNWLPEKSGDWESVYTTAGRWRLEIPHPAPAKEIRYLHLLEASGDPDAQPLAAEKIQTEKTDGVRFTDRAGIRWEITFARQGKIAATVQRTAPDGTVARETL